MPNPIQFSSVGAAVPTGYAPSWTGGPSWTQGTCTGPSSSLDCPLNEFEVLSFLSSKMAGMGGGNETVK